MNKGWSLAYDEDHQYLTALFQGEFHPVIWKICYWESGDRGKGHFYAPGFRANKGRIHPYDNIYYTPFDLTENKEKVLSKMGTKKRELRTWYLVWRVPYGDEQYHAHFKLCKSGEYGQFKHRDIRCWAKLEDLFGADVFNKVALKEQ